MKIYAHDLTPAGGCVRRICATEADSSVVKELSKYIDTDLWVRVHVGGIYDYWIKVISINDRECKCYAATAIFSYSGDSPDSYFDLEESMLDIHTISTPFLTLTGEVLTTEELFDRDNDIISW